MSLVCASAPSVHQCVTPLNMVYQICTFPEELLIEHGDDRRLDVDGQWHVATPLQFAHLQLLMSPVDFQQGYVEEENRLSEGQRLVSWCNI